MGMLAWLRNRRHTTLSLLLLGALGTMLFLRHSYDGSRERERETPTTIFGNMLPIDRKMDLDVQDRSELLAAAFLRDTVSIATEEKELEIIAMATMSAPFAERARFQQEQVEKFCQTYGLENAKYQPPPKHLHSFRRHLLVDDESQTLFCFAPKVGCTNLKVLLFETQGYINTSDLRFTRAAIDPGKMEWLVAKQSFMHRNATQCNYILKNYFKYVMYRNPLERLASAYRAKVERLPLIGLKDEDPHHNWLRREIYRYKHPMLYRIWLHGMGRQPVNISFPDFVDYWLTGAPRADDHFMTQMELCFPCQVRYDFYGNFNDFNKDAGVFIERIHANSSKLRSSYHSEETKTDKLLLEYFGQLGETQRRGVFNKLAVELEFYYNLFPEQTNVHKQILRITDNIPQPVDLSRSHRLLF